MRTVYSRTLVIALLLGALSFSAWSTASADEMTCPEHTPVTIDIKPGNSQNRIKLSSKGVVLVAVLTTTTPSFDATLFIPEMAHLTDAANAMTAGCTGAVAVRWEWKDENGDGQPDLVFVFNTQDLDLTSSSTAATLMAHGSYGGTITHIMGSDSVKVLP